MRDKYIYEQYPSWFGWGKGTLSEDIMIGYNTEREQNLDTGNVLKQEISNALMEEHNLVVEKLVDIALAWAESDHEAFTKYWYKE